MMMLDQLIADLKSWLDSTGWIANALTLGSALAAAGLIVWRERSSLFGNASFERLVKGRRLKAWTKDAVPEIADIAIVDDNPSDFPVTELKRAGYRVRTYKQVHLSDLSGLSAYDLVFLDMHGIVKDDMTEGGLKLIGQLRLRNPRQRICAVSSKTFDPTATAFFKQADDVQKKPISAQKCREVIDGLLSQKLDLLSLSMLADEQLRSVPRTKRRLLIRLFNASIVRGTAPTPSSIEEVLGHPNESLRLILMDLSRIVQYASR